MGERLTALGSKNDATRGENGSVDKMQETEEDKAVK